MKNIFRFWFWLSLLPLRVKLLGLQTALFSLLLVRINKISGKLGFGMKFRFTPLDHDIHEANPQNAKIGILIQGPIENLRTLEKIRTTIDTYSIFFPEAQIVISTWKPPLDSTFDLEARSNVKIVYSEDPGSSWPTNLLRQVISTSNGLDAFTESPDLIVMKSRTDQRITNPFTFEYVNALIKSTWNGNTRLWVTDYGTGRNRLYGITDQLQFGRLNVLKEFWAKSSIKELHRSIVESNEVNLIEVRRISVAVHEVILSVRFLEKRGHRVQWNWVDHLESLRNHFGIVDSMTIGLELLSRDLSVIDHVLPGMLKSKIPIEQHLTFGEWIVINNTTNTPFLQNGRPIDAMKVPQSDLVMVEAVWGDE